MIRNFILNLARKLAPDAVYVLNPQMLLILRDVEREIRKAAALPADVSGEARRSVVYGRLVQRYPEIPRNHIGLVIELAIERAK